MSVKLNLKWTSAMKGILTYNDNHQ